MSLSLDLALNHHAEHRSFLFWSQHWHGLGASPDETIATVLHSWQSILNGPVRCRLHTRAPLTFAEQGKTRPAAACSRHRPSPQAPTATQDSLGDPARSDSEAAALAYMRVVIRAQRRFNKQYGHFATSLAELVHSGTFTKRMVNPDRGDYTANFKGKKDSFVLTMTPKNLDAQHRSFYAEDDGKIHAEETKAADASSPVVK